jgi:hypothetical protein
MVTYVFDYTLLNPSDKTIISSIRYDFAHILHQCFNKDGLINDKSYQKMLLNTYDFINPYDIQSLKIIINGHHSALRERKLKQKEKLIQLKSELNKDLKKKDLNKLIKKIKKIEKQLKTGETFGGKTLLKEINKLKSIDKSCRKQRNLIKEKEAEFIENRKWNIMMVGNSHDTMKGTYKVYYDLENNMIYYYPYGKRQGLEKSTDKAGYKISIKLNIKGNNRKEFIKHISDLQKQGKYIPITFSLNENKVSLAFDSELVENYDNSIKTKFKENREKDKENDILKSNKEHFKQSLIDIKLHDKVSDVHAAIDLNPKYLGVCIYNDKTQTLIQRFEYDYSLFFDKIKNKGDYKEYLKEKKYYTDKHKHEIIHVIKDVFKMFHHYNVSQLFIEDLSMYNVNLNTNANNQINNMWYKNLQYHMIHKNCIKYNIKEMYINPAYTSYIGNLMYNAHDPIAASVGVLIKGLNLSKGRSWNQLPINENTVRVMMTTDNSLLIENQEILVIEDLINLHKKGKITTKRVRNHDMGIVVRKAVWSKKSKVTKVTMIDNNTKLVM